MKSKLIAATAAVFLASAGVAAAQTVVLFTILLVVSLLQLYVLREKK